MPSLKSLRLRINSVKSTRKITQAMKMVAAAKLRRAQTQAEAARPYAERMERMLASLGASVAGSPDAPKLLVGTGADKVHLLVVVTAERGLCGGFNTNVGRFARAQVRALEAEGKTVKIITVGKKGNDLLKRQFSSNIIEFVDLRSVRYIGFENADAVGRSVIARFEAGEFDVCTVFYSRFKSVIQQFPTALQIIPAQIPEKSAVGGSLAAYDFEPDEASILATLLPRNISMQIFAALLENAASAQGARMSAMDNATRNAGDMIKKQTMKYNRSRQAMITKELIEIISGAEAL